jgi:3-dehydroquinate synthase
VACLRSLPPRQLQCGLAEVVKYGVIADATFFAWQESRVAELLAIDPATYAQVVHRSCELKAEVVLADERDLSGRRATLNYGHTFGHALEALAGYGTLTHGEAVAIGMGLAADLALALAPTGALREVVRRQDALLQALGLPIRATGFDPAAVQVAMRSDKKYEKGKNRLLLPRQLGDVRLVKNVDEDAILAAIGGRCDAS